MATAQAFTGFDHATPAGDCSAMVVVERVFDRWKMGDIWMVEFDAFDPRTGVCTRDMLAFSSYIGAFSFRAGCVVPRESDPDSINDELPF